MRGTATLSATSLNIAFGGLRALDNATLTLRPGCITGIIGPNGAGKSTLFNVLAGVMRPASGQVMLGDTDITRLPVHRRARRGVARTFQLARELDSLTVLENLLLATPSHPGERLWNVLFARQRVCRAEQDAIARAFSLLERARLLPLANQPAGSLSGGQKKLLELCRALMTEPSIVLLDEPAAGVNPVLVDSLGRFISDLRGEGMTFGLVEHNMDMVAALCDHVCVMAQGAVLIEGSFADVTADTRVRAAYLGEIA